METWKPISTAPKDGTFIDIVAKFWFSRTDTFEYRRFPNAWWKDSYDSKKEWVGVQEGWRPTHWMPVPELPEVTEGEG